MTSNEYRLEPFDQKVESTVHRHHMLARGDRVVVAISGGPDSVVLLHVLYRLRNRWGITLIAAHLNHDLRGADADADAAFVAEYAGTLGIPCVVEKANVKRYCKAQRCSLETGAREMRYAFLERVALAQNATRIATGHTADDQAETVLMRLVRGSGPDGLSAIRPVRDDRVIRPLLEVTRTEVTAYQKAYGLSARLDASNTDQDMLRNKIRHHLIPLLQNEYNPEIQGALSRLAEVLRVESDYFDQELDLLTTQLMQPVDRGALCIDLTTWQTVPVALQRRILRRIIQTAGGQATRLTFDHVEQARTLFDTGQAGQILHLPGDIGLEYRKTAGLICRTTAAPYQMEMHIPGTTSIPGSDYTITTTLVEVNQRPEVLSKASAVFDAEALPDHRLLVRSRQPGDRMTPFGMPGTKSLKKLCNEWDIPRLMRDRIPVVTDGSQVLWIPGHRRSNLAPITPQTRKVLVMTYTDQ